MQRYEQDLDLFFSNDSIWKYWFGFIASDGCIYKERPVCAIKLAKRDVEHLQLFKNSMLATNPIHVRDKYVDIRISNRILLDRLLDNGIKSRKTLDITVSCDLASSGDFWRGAVDGDGCLSVGINKSASKNESYKPLIYLSTASFPLVEQYVRFLNSNDISNYISERKLPSGKCFYYVNVSKRSSVRNCIELLGYKDLSKPSLFRKRQKALEIDEYLHRRV